jgi:hypothetical protein
MKVSAIRFYKFRAVTETHNLAGDYALQALVNSYAVFSGRRNFNDLFDSKIDIPHLKWTPLSRPKFGLNKL